MQNCFDPKVNYTAHYLRERVIEHGVFLADKSRFVVKLCCYSFPEFLVDRRTIHLGGNSCIISL